MPRPKKLLVEKTTKKWTFEDEKYLISKDKVDLLNHKAINKIWIGGKENGKTRSILTRDLSYLETNPDAHLLKFKKYIKGGITRLFNAMYNISLEVRMLGFDIPEYISSQSFGYRDNNTNKKLNNSIEYLSLEDLSSIAGAEAQNNGFYASVQFEEPVQFGEYGKVPTPEEWKSTIKMIKDTVTRSNRKYSQLKNKPVPLCYFNYSLNPWDDGHPLVIQTEKAFPEETFLQFVLQDMIENHTKAVYEEKTDTLYIRLTKFANPITRAIERLLKQNDIKSEEEWDEVPKDALNAFPEFAELKVNHEYIKAYLKENITPLYLQAQKAIDEQDKSELSRILGLAFNGDITNKKIYNLNNAKIMDTDKILATKPKIQSFTLGFDIDTREGRGFVGTPIWDCVWTDLFGNKQRNIIAGKQFKINSYGDSAKLVPIYVSQLKEKLKELLEKDIIIYDKQHPQFLYMDENKANYLYQLRDEGFISGKARKHGNYGIIERQDILQLAIDSGLLIIDKDNVKLINDLKKCVAKEGERKRDETGKKEKDFDYINSLEYAFYPYRVAVHDNNYDFNKEFSNEED